MTMSGGIWGVDAVQRERERERENILLKKKRRKTSYASVLHTKITLCSTFLKVSNCIFVKFCKQQMEISLRHRLRGRQLVRQRGVHTGKKNQHNQLITSLWQDSHTLWTDSQGLSETFDPELQLADLREHPLLSLFQVAQCWTHRLDTEHIHCTLIICIYVHAVQIHLCRYSTQ